MALDVTLPIAIRMAGPALFLLLGAALVALSAGRRERIALGASLAAFGGALVVSNLGIAGAGDPAFFAALTVGIAGAFASAGTLVWTRGGWRTRPAELVIVALVAAAYVFRGAARIPDYFERNDAFRAAASFYDGVPATVFGFAQVLQAGLLATVLGWSLAAARGPPYDRTIAGACTGLLVLAGFGVGSDVLSGYNSALFVDAPLAFAIVLACAALWMRAALRNADRTARNVALVTLAATLLGMLRHATSGHDSIEDPIAAVGLARLVGWVIVAWSLIRGGWLDTAFLSRHRAGLAAAALATLFVVAQVAQQYFEAQYGLMMGGAVAGALLFAASPVQRAMERLSAGQGKGQGQGGDGSALRREEVYRKALRIALKDRRISRAEELHLHELAQELAIPGARAHELLIEVERETTGAVGR